MPITVLKQDYQDDQGGIVCGYISENWDSATRHRIDELIQSCF